MILGLIYQNKHSYHILLTLYKFRFKYCLIFILMDRPYFYNIFDTTISHFIINDISKILKLSTIFLKNTKLKKIGCIKNYDTIKELDNLLKFKNFKPILDLITPSIYKYINLIFKKICKI